MKRLFNVLSLLAAAVFAVAAVSSCDEKEPDVTPEDNTLGVTFGEVTVDGTSATVTITPAGDAERISWGYAPAAEETPEEWTSEDITSGEAKTVTASDLADGEYRFFAYAENESGKSETVSSDAFTIGEAGPSLVTYEIKNMTAYSLDVDVKMTEDCARYCVTIFYNGSYDEARFIESAQNSITPNEDYPMQPYVVFTEDALVPERMLSKNTLASTDVCVGVTLNRSASASGSSTTDLELVKYQVAIYAEDKDGNHAVYTSEEFTLPEAEFNDTPSVEITAETIDLTSVEAKYTVTGECEKLVTGYCVPAEHEDIDWEDEAVVENFLSTVAVESAPKKYTEPLVQYVSKSLLPESDIYVYAIAITADGKLGKLSYSKFTTKAPELKGDGTVKLTFVNEDPLGVLNFTLELENGATGARVMVMDETNFKSLNIAANLEWIFSDAGQGDYWTEYTAADLAEKDNKIMLPANYPGVKYHVYAAAINPDGNVSPYQKFDDITSLTEPVKEGIDYSLGTGEATITVIKEETFYTPLIPLQRGI